MKRRLVMGLSQLGIFVLFLVFWENVSGNPDDPGILVDELFVGKPSAIWDSLVTLWRSGTLLDHTWVTTQEALIGFVGGCVVGMFVGILFGVNETVAALLNPFVAGLYAIPRLALTPLFIIWFGLGMESKVALVMTIVFFIVFYSTYTGVREVDPELRNALRVMDASAIQLHRLVTLPSAAVWVISSLRVAVPYAFVGAVVGEMIASSEGLGFLIGRGSSALNPNATFAAIALVIVMSAALNGVVSLIERYVSRWKSSGSESFQPAI